MVGILSIKVDSKILSDLENTRLEKHSKSMEMLLQCDIKTIKGIKMLLNGVARDYEINKEVKKVRKCQNLLDLMEKD